MRHIAIGAAAVVLAIAAFLVPRSRAALPAPVAPAVALPSAEADPVKAHHEESLRRHRELKERAAAETDPLRRALLEKELGELDRRLEIEGLELKRSMAEAAGEAERVRAIDELLRVKRR